MIHRRMIFHLMANRRIKFNLGFNNLFYINRGKRMINNLLLINLNSFLLWRGMFHLWSNTISFSCLIILSFFVRTIWTVVMLLGYITIINAGHFYVASLVFLINIAIFKEILSLKRNYDKEIKIPLFYLLNWYFFAVAVFYFYGKLFSSKLTRFF